jgi:hypothetical protein
MRNGNNGTEGTNWGDSRWHPLYNYELGFQNSDFTNEESKSGQADVGGIDPSGE